jgi:hypothetical protein
MYQAKQYSGDTMQQGNEKKMKVNKKRPDSVRTAKNIIRRLYDLCDIAGYGIRSGINVGEKGDRAAYYILNELHRAGLVDARLESIEVNSPFPEHYEVTVKENGKEISLTGSCTPLQWTAGTPQEGIAGKLVYVGDGLHVSF